MTHASPTPPGVKRLRASRRYGDTAEFEPDPRQVVSLTPEELRRCREFARDVYSTNRSTYGARGQSNPQTVMRQIYAGKAGELGARRYLMRLGLECTEVDFEVRAAPGKSFDPDLKCLNKHLHVKTQRVEESRLYGISWIFQYAGDGAGHTDHAIFGRRDDPDQYVLFCQLNERRVVICAAPQVVTLHRQQLFHDLRIESYREKKKAVYYDPLLSTLTDKEVWAFAEYARHSRG